MKSAPTLRPMPPEYGEIERVARRLRRELEQRHRFDLIADPQPATEESAHGVEHELRVLSADPAEPVAVSAPRIWWLVLESGGKPCQIRLQRSVTIVGRDDSCDVRIPATTVSKFHCRLEVRGARLHVQDLQSRNGTFHNDRRIVDGEIGSGDQLCVGPVTFRVFGIKCPEAGAAGSLQRSAADETCTAWPGLK